MTSSLKLSELISDHHHQLRAEDHHLLCGAVVNNHCH
ncbi:hypothetical protein SOVF_044040 [Spinacia oleracea]|nr:hypothetical protein SOVF_044040 [Spinacia oleracea]